MAFHKESPKNESQARSEDDIVGGDTGPCVHPENLSKERDGPRRGCVAATRPARAQQGRLVDDAILDVNVFVA